MLNEIFDKHNAKKHPHFASIYEEWFEKNRDKITSILEIGIYEGGSLNSWAEYFPNAEIYGIDVKEKEWSFISDRIHPFIGSQSDKEFLKKTFDNIKFDIIIDDGCHFMEHQRASMKMLFKYIKPGGVYIIEDLHTSYWPKYGGMLKGKEITVEKLKSFVDGLNHKAYKGDKRAEKYMSKKHANFYDKNIESVHFYKSICFIRRRK